MAESEPRDPENNQEAYQALRPDQALELWKHFAGTGAADKNTMVAVASWLLGVSVTISAYIVTQLFKSDNFAFVQPWRAFCLASLGLGISFAAGYVALLYGGYSNRNWAKADEIAHKSGLDKLMPDYLILPDYSSAIKNEGKNKTYGLPGFAVGWSEDCDPKRRLAPVFLLFASLALLILLLHLVFWIISVSQILGRMFL